MTLNRKSRLFLLSLLAVTLLSARPTVVFGNERPKEKRRILIATGEDYPGHKWKETAPVLRSELAKDQRLAIDMLTDLKTLATTRLTDYDAVVIHFKNYDPKVPGRKGLENLVKFVEQGGGLMFVHFACGAFEEFKADYEKIAGRVWFGLKPPPGRSQHDPYGPFQVRITRRNHPVTKGLKDFETKDELYTCLEGKMPIETLATAVSKRDGKTYPMAFVFRVGKGRVFHSVLGHDVTAFKSSGTAELHRRGCAWAAGLEPAGRAAK